MEDFKNYMKNKNIEEIQIYLKNSQVDLLKTIAKRFKIPASTKRKELIIQDILHAVTEDRPFMDVEPSVDVMTFPQLRNKARQLNLDISRFTQKQALRTAIVKKMAQQHDGATTVMTTTTTSETELGSKSLPFLKNLAKSYGIKVSKKSKNQLTTLILQAQMMGKTPAESKGSKTHTLAKMRKNELIVMAEAKGLVHKGKTKEALVRMLEQVSSDNAGVVTIVPTAPREEEWSYPLSPEMEQKMRNDRKTTIPVIREILRRFDIKIPKGMTKRNDLIHLLVSVNKDGAPEPPSKPGKKDTAPASEPESISEEKKKKDAPRRKKIVIEEEEEEVVEEDVIQPPSSSPSSDREGEGEEEVVSLDDIQTPFEPIPLEDLLEEPSEKQLQEELYRCLQFYEHPK